VSGSLVGRVVVVSVGVSVVVVVSGTLVYGTVVVLASAGVSEVVVPQLGGAQFL
jgi:hypothetical protein